MMLGGVERSEEKKDIERVRKIERRREDIVSDAGRCRQRARVQNREEKDIEGLERKTEKERRYTERYWEG